MSRTISFNRLSNGDAEIIDNGNSSTWQNMNNVKGKVHTHPQPDFSGKASYIIIKDGTRAMWYRFLLAELTTINGVAWTGTNPVDAKNAIMNNVFGGSSAYASVKINQVITFGALANVLHTAAPFQLTAKSSSGLPVTYVSSDPTKATVTSGGLVTPVAAGSTNITASCALDANYNAATPVVQPLTLT